MLKRAFAMLCVTAMLVTGASVDALAAGSTVNLPATDSSAKAEWTNSETIDGTKDEVHVSSYATLKSALQTAPSSLNKVKTVVLDQDIEEKETDNLAASISLTRNTCTYILDLNGHHVNVETKAHILFELANSTYGSGYSADLIIVDSANAGFDTSYIKWFGNLDDENNMFYITGYQSDLSVIGDIGLIVMAGNASKPRTVIRAERGNVLINGAFLKTTDTYSESYAIRMNGFSDTSCTISNAWIQSHSYAAPLYYKTLNGTNAPKIVNSHIVTGGKTTQKIKYGQLSSDAPSTYKALFGSSSVMWEWTFDYWGADKNGSLGNPMEMDTSLTTATKAFYVQNGLASETMDDVYKYVLPAGHIQLSKNGYKTKFTSHTFTLKSTTSPDNCTQHEVNHLWCTTCGYEVDEETDVIGAHDWDEAVATKIVAATEEADGYAMIPCKNCDKTKKQTIYQIKSIKLSKTSYVYDGKAKKPTVTVKDRKGNDITLYFKPSYKNNTKAGSASVKVATYSTYTARYTLSKTLKYSILPKKAKINSITPQTKAMKVKFTSQKESGVDGYILSYRVKGTTSWKNVTVAKDASSATVKNLKKGKKYEVKMKAYVTIDGKKKYGEESKVIVSGLIK